MEKTSIILDVDTGIDDAFAVLFAAIHPAINLLGITCVDGNTNIENVVANTLKVLDAAQAPEIPVARGALRPLLGESHYAEYVHGADGMGDLGISPSKRTVDPRSAVELLRDLIENSSDPVTIVPLAPLTNIALFLRAFPETAKKIHRIVLMGGSASAGNATAAAEFNVWHDPEAAAIMRPGITREQALELQSSTSQSAQFGGELALAFMERLGVSPITLGDYGAVASVIRPDLFTTAMFDVVVDTSAGPARGQTIVDRRDAFLRELEPIDLEDSAKVRVTLDLDVDAVVKLWLETVNTKK
jgi:pyrimidine-specific ribonucleoside hydrolase